MRAAWVLAAADRPAESEVAAHDARGTDIAWSPRTNRILTTAQDRNAYVWTKEGGDEWKPMLVILRITAAAARIAAARERQSIQYAWRIQRTQVRPPHARRVLGREGVAPQVERAELVVLKTQGVSGGGAPPDLLHF